MTRQIRLLEDELGAHAECGCCPRREKLLAHARVILREVDAARRIVE